jgi:hypothetical protein
MPEEMVRMITKFQIWLPDMDILLNENDEPRVVIPWGIRQDLLRKEEMNRDSQPATFKNMYPVESWRMTFGIVADDSHPFYNCRNGFRRTFSKSNLEIHNRRM